MRAKPRPHKVGDVTRLQSIPEGLAPEVRKIFEHCLGKRFKITGKQGALLVLDVSKEVDQKFGGIMNDIRVEPRHLEPVGPR